MYRSRYSTAALLGAWLCVAFAFPVRAEVIISIDKAAQRMTVAVDGERRWSWPVSTGRRGYDTPAGSFRPFRLEEDHYSKEWDEAPMPHSIFFTMDGHAIHGSYEIRKLGRRASHGCVRLAPNNAAKLFALVKQQGLSNARVVVTGDATAPLVAQRRVPAAKPAAGALSPAPAPEIGPEQAYGYAPVAPAAEPFAPPPPAFAEPSARGWN